MDMKSLPGFLILIGLLLGLFACEQQLDVPPDLATIEHMTVSELPQSINSSPTSAPLLTIAPPTSLNSTATPIPEVSVTPTLTSTQTATSTPSPTSEYPSARVLMQANCRYGPGTAYLYSHGLYEGDLGEVHGRNYSSTWLWVQPLNLDRHCWVAASVVEVNGNIQSVVVANNTRLPFTTFLGPPKEVQAVRDGSQVIVRWSDVNVKPPEDSRGYLIEATLCQGGVLTWVAVHTESTSYIFTDEPGCNGESGGKLYAVEKHGYTDPVTIPWP